MPAKPNPKNWNDIQMALAAISITATIGLWNTFATPAKIETAQNLAAPAAAISASPAPALPPNVKVYFGGSAPQARQVAQAAQQPTTKQQKQGRQNNSGSAPAPVAQTRSS